MARKKIPIAIETEVMYLSDLKCCIDNKKGDHIHHLDGNNSNNTIENLALLCYECHNLASIKASLSKTLSQHVIKKYRNHHYEVIKKQRENALKQISGKVLHSFTQEDIIEATTTSIVLLEIVKIQEEYYRSFKMDRRDILEKLIVYKVQSNPRILLSLLEFLSRVAYETKSGLPTDMVLTIEGLIMSYFLLLDSKTTPKQLFEVGKAALNIARTIVYNTSIHSHNFPSMQVGYSIIKFMYAGAPTYKITKLKNEVVLLFDELKSQMERPERDDLDNAELMRQIHFDDLNNDSFTFPNYPQKLLKLLL